MKNKLTKLAFFLKDAFFLKKRQAFFLYPEGTNQTQASELSLLSHWPQQASPGTPGTLDKLLEDSHLSDLGLICDVDFFRIYTKF